MSENKIITDVGEAAELIHSALRRRHVRRPEDLKFIIHTLIEEMQAQCDVCDKADFLFTEADKAADAAEHLDELFNWLTALRNNQSFLQNQVDSCRRHIRKQVMTDGTRPKLMTQTLDNVAAMLRQLAGDFEGWRMEHEKGGWNLLVLYKPVTLHCNATHVDVPFGRFIVKLSLSKMVRGVARPYSVLPEAHKLVVRGHEATPHPHVRDSQLCEGDGEVPITKALKEGDLFVFFMMIDNILRTYNPASPFTKLELFANVYTSQNPGVQPNAPAARARRREIPEDHFRCQACGEVAHYDEEYTCNFCDNNYCGNCASYCSNGDTTVCEGCRDDMYSSGCDDCDHFGTPGCVIRESVECEDCEEHIRADGANYCSGNWYCDSCMEARSDRQEPCCPHATSSCAFGSWLYMHNRDYYNELFEQPNPPNHATLPGRRERVNAAQEELNAANGTGFAAPAAAAGGTAAPGMTGETGTTGTAAPGTGAVEATPAAGWERVEQLTAPEDLGIRGFMNQYIGTAMGEPAQREEAPPPVPNADGTLVCYDCAGHFRPNMVAICAGIVRCNACMEMRVRDGNPCCETPYRSCAYGLTASRTNQRRFEELSFSLPENAFTAAPDNPDNPTTGFGPPSGS